MLEQQWKPVNKMRENPKIACWMKSLKAHEYLFPAAVRWMVITLKTSWITVQKMLCSAYTNNLMWLMKLTGARWSIKPAKPVVRPRCLPSSTKVKMHNTRSVLKSLNILAQVKKGQISAITFRMLPLVGRRMRLMALSTR